jgi:DNA polymerase-3 subunit delta'
MSKAEPPAPDRVAGCPHPRETVDLIGHEEAEAAMLAAYTRDRFPHAWLLSGRRGIGKATLAYRFARFLFSDASDFGGLFGAAEDLGVDPESTAARRVAAGSHGNLFTLARMPQERGRSGEYYGVIRIDDVRRLGPFLTRTAHEPGWRVIVVDSADDMNMNAQNGLLKSLEEPPPQCVFLLVSESPGALLATIRSRCRHLAIKPLAEAAMDRVLGGLLPELEADERRALGLLSEGSPGRAAALAAGGGLSIYREMIALIDGLPGLDIGQVHALSERLGRRTAEADYRVFIDLLDNWLIRLCRDAASGLGSMEIVAGEQALMARLIAGGGLEHWIEVWEKMSRLTERADAVNLDRKAVIVNLFMALDRAAQSVGAQE